MSVNVGRRSEIRVKAEARGVEPEKCPTCGGVIYKIGGVFQCVYCVPKGRATLHITLELNGGTRKTFHLGARNLFELRRHIERNVTRISNLRIVGRPREHVWGK